MTARQGFWIGLALGLTFSLGFSAAVLVLPRAEAQSTAPVLRWEYRRYAHNWDGGRWAREAGDQGWEMFQFVHDPRGNDSGMYFRRPARR